MPMAVRRWAWLLVLTLGVVLPLCGQQQSEAGQQPQSGQQTQSNQPPKTSTQDLPSAPQPQPTAGQKKQEKLPAAPPPQPPPQPSSEPGPYGPAGPSATSEPPRATPPELPGSSTSKEDKVDISPPANDTKAHPNAGPDNSEVGEFHPFDPHRAAKDVEVGDFYYKRHNYRAAVSRYREALLYKPNDAIATFSLADALEKAGDLREAAQNYEAYLKILPNGPKAGEAHKALQRLKGKLAAAGKTADSAKVAKQ
jgi:tetratricopeptide (TPR) repeat protein